MATSGGGDTGPRNSFEQAMVNAAKKNPQSLANKRRLINQQNAQGSFVERTSAQRARKRAAAIQAAGQASAAGMRASTAATASARLLAEFESGRAQRSALQQRRSDQAIGGVEAQFGAAGVQSTGAAQEAQRQSNLQGNIQQSGENLQRERILGQARSAISNAFATGISAQASLDAAGQQGAIFKRKTENLVDTGVKAFGASGGVRNIS